MSRQVRVRTWVILGLLATAELQALKLSSQAMHDGDKSGWTAYVALLCIVLMAVLLYWLPLTLTHTREGAKPLDPGKAAVPAVLLGLVFFLCERTIADDYRGTGRVSFEHPLGPHGLLAFFAGMGCLASAAGSGAKLRELVAATPVSPLLDWLLAEPPPRSDSPPREPLPAQPGRPLEVTEVRLEVGRSPAEEDALRVGAEGAIEVLERRVALARTLSSAVRSWRWRRQLLGAGALVEEWQSGAQQAQAAAEQVARRVRSLGLEPTHPFSLLTVRVEEAARELGRAVLARGATDVGELSASVREEARRPRTTLPSLRGDALRVGSVAGALVLLILPGPLLREHAATQREAQRMPIETLQLAFDGVEDGTWLSADTHVLKASLNWTELVAWAQREELNDVNALAILYTYRPNEDGRDPFDTPAWNENWRLNYPRSNHQVCNSGPVSYMGNLSTRSTPSGFLPLECRSKLGGYEGRVLEEVILRFEVRFNGVSRYVVRRVKVDGVAPVVSVERGQGKRRTVKISAEDEGSGIAGITVDVDGQSLTCSGEAPSWTCEPPVGARTLTAKVKDTAGNETESVQDLPDP